MTAIGNLLLGVLGLGASRDQWRSGWWWLVGLAVVVLCLVVGGGLLHGVGGCAVVGWCSGGWFWCL